MFNTFCRFMRSFWKNAIVKRKLRPYIQLALDPQFRKDINYLFEITRNCTHLDKAVVKFGSIVPGHKILYPKYVQSLKRTSQFPPLRVIAVDDGFRIVDGNHRFAAMQGWLEADDLIYVEILR